MGIKDSGKRREFNSGAVRDISEGKGRCDLLPLDTIAPLMPTDEYASVIHKIYQFTRTGDCGNLYSAIVMFSIEHGWTSGKVVLEVSKQFEEGAAKYGEHNWEKGIPLHCYIDSAVRHFLKFIDSHEDEPHDRAFIWNLLCAIWTCDHRPEMVDMFFPDLKDEEEVIEDCLNELESSKQQHS